MSASSGQPVHVARGHDRSGEHHNLGIGILTFKVATADSNGAMLVVELAHHTPGGPARHLHHAQDEWFYVAEGTYVLEVGSERFQLGPGDSVFGPRGVPHAWAYTGTSGGRIVFVVSPAGELEAFFRALSVIKAAAPEDPAFWPPYGMQLVGPPLDLAAL